MKLPEFMGHGGENHMGLMIQQKNSFSLLSSTYVSASVRKEYPISVFSVFNCEKTNGADSFFPPM